MAAQAWWKTGKLENWKTAKGAVLSPEKRDFTVLLTKFAFIVTFEEFLVLYSEQSFYKCFINLSCPAGRHYRRK